MRGKKVNKSGLRYWKIIIDEIEKRREMRFNEISHYFDKERWETKEQHPNRKKNEFAELDHLMSYPMICKILRREVKKGTLEKIEKGRMSSYKPIHIFDDVKEWSGFLQKYQKKYQDRLNDILESRQTKNPYELVEELYRIGKSLIFLQDSANVGSQKFGGPLTKYLKEIENLRIQLYDIIAKMDKEDNIQEQINELQHDELESIFENFD